MVVVVVTQEVVAMMVNLAERRAASVKAALAQEVVRSINGSSF